MGGICSSNADVKYAAHKDSASGAAGDRGGTRDGGHATPDGPGGGDAVGGSDGASVGGAHEGWGLASMRAPGTRGMFLGSVLAGGTAAAAAGADGSAGAHAGAAGGGTNPGASGGGALLTPGAGGVAHGRRFSTRSGEYAQPTGANAPWATHHGLGEEEADTASLRAVQCSLFASCLTSTEVSALAAAGALVRAAPGERLYRALDEQAQWLYIVESGSVVLEVASDAARDPDAPLRSWPPGSIAAGAGLAAAAATDAALRVEDEEEEEEEEMLTPADLFHMASPNLGTFLSPLHGRLTLAEQQASTLAAEAEHEARKAREAREAHAARKAAEAKQKDRERSERLKTSSDTQFRGLAASLLSTMAASINQQPTRPHARRGTILPQTSSNAGASPSPAPITPASPAHPPSAASPSPSNSTLSPAPTPSPVPITPAGSDPSAAPPATSPGFSPVSSPLASPSSLQRNLKPPSLQVPDSTPTTPAPGSGGGGGVSAPPSSTASGLPPFSPSNAIALSMLSLSPSRRGTSTGSIPSATAASTVPGTLEQPKSAIPAAQHKRTRSTPQLAPFPEMPTAAEGGEGEEEEDEHAAALRRRAATPPPIMPSHHAHSLSADSSAGTLQLAVSPPSAVATGRSGHGHGQSGGSGGGSAIAARSHSRRAESPTSLEAKGMALQFPPSPLASGTPLSPAGTAKSPGAGAVSRVNMPSGFQSGVTSGAPTRRGSGSMLSQRSTVLGGGGMLLGSHALPTYNRDFDESLDAESGEDLVAPGIVRVGVLQRGQLLGLCGFLSPQQVYLSSGVSWARDTRVLCIPRAKIESMLSGPAGPRLRDALGEKLLAALHSAPWLSQLPPSARITLASLFHHAHVPRRSYLFHGGNVTSDSSPLYFLLEGEVSVEVADEKGKGKKSVKTIGAGNFVGELSVVLGTCRTGTARAMTDLVVRYITRRSIMRFFHTLALLPLASHASRALLAAYPPLRDEQLLEQMGMQGAFARFCLKEFSAENIEFWQTAVRLRKVILSPAARGAYTRSQVLTEAALLYTRYISERSLVQINLKETVRATTSRALRSGTLSSESFASAEAEILHLMVHDNFSRFKASAAFKVAKESLEAPAPTPYPRRRPQIVDPSSSGKDASASPSANPAASPRTERDGMPSTPTQLPPSPACAGWDECVSAAPWLLEAAANFSTVSLPARFAWKERPGRHEEELRFDDSGFVVEMKSREEEEEEQRQIREAKAKAEAAVAAASATAQQAEQGDTNENGALLAQSNGRSSSRSPSPRGGAAANSSAPTSPAAKPSPTSAGETSVARASRGGSQGGATAAMAAAARDRDNDGDDSEMLSHLGSDLGDSKLTGGRVAAGDFSPMLSPTVGSSRQVTERVHKRGRSKHAVGGGARYASGSLAGLFPNLHMLASTGHGASANPFASAASSHYTFASSTPMHLQRSLHHNASAANAGAGSAAATGGGGSTANATFKAAVKRSKDVAKVFKHSPFAVPLSQSNKARRGTISRH